MRQDQPAPSRLRFFVGTTMFWIAIGIVYGTLLYQAMAVEGMEHSAGRLIIWQSFVWGSWALLTPFVWKMAERWPLSEARRWRNGLTNVAGGTAIVFLHLLFTTILTQLFAPMEWTADESWLEGLISNLRNRSIFDGIVFVSVLAVANWVGEVTRSQERAIVAVRLESELARAELHSLQLQIQPHFLFNSLHSIAGLVREGRPADAIETIAAVSELLRYVLDCGQRQEVTLDEELGFVERYLQVQSTRFEDRLTVQMDVDRTLRATLVPNLILLPLVENAIGHGISRRREGGRVEITATGEDDRLRLSVVNQGPPLESIDAAGQRIGLANIEERLRMLYGDSASLTLQNVTDGVAAIIDLPLKKEKR